MIQQKKKQTLLEQYIKIIFFIMCFLFFNIIFIMFLLCVYYIGLETMLNTWIITSANKTLCMICIPKITKLVTHWDWEPKPDHSSKHYLNIKPHSSDVLVPAHPHFLCYLLSHVWLFVTTMDYSPPGSSVHEILQAKILEWVAIPFSRGSSPPRDQMPVSCTAGRFFTFWATREVPTC